MNKENLMQAIGDLDDELIQDVYSAPCRKRIIHWQPIVTAAACLAFVILLALPLLHSKESSVTVFANRLTEEPVTISESNTVAVLRQLEIEPQVQLTLPLEMTISKPTTLTVSSGTFQVIDSKNSTLLYEGNTCQVENDVIVLWTATVEDDINSFEMSMVSKTQKETILLQYTTEQKWVIQLKPES